MRTSVIARLVREREIWLPTTSGWLALLCALAAAGIFLLAAAHPFLAVTEPVGASVLVVEGWMDPEELQQAAALFRNGGYERLITSGGPRHVWPPRPDLPTFAAAAAAYLKAHGVPSERVSAAPAPDTLHDRTYQSAVAVREWMRRAGLSADAIDVVSVGTHARRSRLLYQVAFGNQVRVGIYAAAYAGYEPQRWWRSHAGRRDVLDQGGGWLWVKCCFWPD